MLPRSGDGTPLLEGSSSVGRQIFIWTEVLLTSRMVSSSSASALAHPPRALHRNLAGGMQCISDRRRDQRLRLRANLVEDMAEVMVQHTVPCRESRELITRTG